ncbi:MAG: hypothetical protein JSU00_28260 [Acidobacteria bacterium]|nr:hypothetical protein [Acidobacteriota bacterium]
MTLGRWLVTLATVGVLAAQPAYVSARRKLDIIESQRAPAGSIYSFTRAEIEAWAAVEIPQIVPDGFRNATVELGTDVATGRALIDFARLRHAKGAPKNWFIDRLIEGERPVAVTIDIRSADGRCTANIRSVQVSGVSATGSVLDFLVKNFFIPLFPNAKIGEPFEIGDRIDSIAIRPQAAYVRIDRSAPAPAGTPPRRVLSPAAH